ncbi:hypothetical protein ACFL2T_05735, partial [Elusimicrobiota bacterium]
CGQAECTEWTWRFGRYTFTTDAAQCYMADTRPEIVYVGGPEGRTGYNAKYDEDCGVYLDRE